MRQVLFASLALAIGSTLHAQTPGNPLLESGTVVGRPILKSVGQALPKVAPQVGETIGKPPGTSAQTPQNPPGFAFDLKNVVAPINPEFLPPALRPAKVETLYESAFKKWLIAFGLEKPADVKTNNFTPGMSRRNRERHKEREWWRD